MVATLLGLVVLLFSPKSKFRDGLVSPLRKVSSCGFIIKIYFEEGSSTNGGSLRLVYCTSFNQTNASRHECPLFPSLNSSLITEEESFY